jgi:DNA-binding LacI/PurR family transcriptional regulator
MSDQLKLRIPISIKDIARMAGVSHSTVSRALRDSPLVNPKTTEEIRKIARELGYQPSAVARGLVTRRTYTIGVVVTTIADPFVSEVVIGIELAANDYGYSVILADSNADPVREQSVVHSFAERRVDGIVVTSSRVGALYTGVLAQMNAPIVLINNQHPGQFVHSVMIDNVQGSREATAHLIGLGHRRIAYIGDRYGHQSDTERLTGYQEALAQAGVPLRAELVVNGDSKPEAAILAMEALLALPDPPTAVFCYNDMTALGVLRAAHVQGVKVPEDLSIVGFDDLFLATYTQPQLTTVRQPMQRMGRMAMESLLRLMSGEASGEAVKVPAELIVRESTAAAR